MTFDWDAGKAASNSRKHGVSFTEASTVFRDTRAIVFYDEAHSADEDRFIAIGRSTKLRLLMMVFTERSGDVIRIISARRANKSEAEVYAQG